MSVILKHEHYLEVSGEKIFYQHLIPQASETKKPTILFLHDAIGSVSQWRGFPDQLVKRLGYPAIVYDRYGYGRSQASSQKRDKNYLHQEALERLPAFLEALGLEEIILFGHSDGGSIAIIFAGQVPRNIHLHGVITEAAHVFVEEITLAGIREIVELAKQSDFLKKLAKFHGDKTDYLFKAWHKTWLSSEFRNWNIEDYLPQITCPALMIQGEDDEYGTQKQVDAIVSQVQGPRQKLMIPGCAHVPHYQAEEEVLKAVGAFLLWRDKILKP
ncbi:MAG: alpha/beta hydrolase [Deltaproteobacteria bacterium]|nr:alpha/beta hydrolase [Deltaproteobacteria bacterium]